MSRRQALLARRHHRAHPSRRRSSRPRRRDRRHRLVIGHHRRATSMHCACGQASRPGNFARGFETSTPAVFRLRTSKMTSVHWRYVTDGGKVHVHLVSNPSHLQAVDPVTSATPAPSRSNCGEGRREYLVLLVHGDACLRRNKASRRDHEVRRYPATPRGRWRHHSRRRRQSPRLHLGSPRSAPALCRLHRATPIDALFHVNGEDVDAVVASAACHRASLQFGSRRGHRSHRYRRHGHSEVDDPTITQPFSIRELKNIHHSGRSTLTTSVRPMPRDLGAAVRRVQAAQETSRQHQAKAYPS